jgi:hypothetical protein
MKTLLTLTMAVAMVFAAGSACASDYSQYSTQSGRSNVNVVSGCIKGSGIQKSEKRTISSFNAIRLDGAFDVTVELQKKRGLEISGDDNLLPYIITEVKGGTLHVTTNKSICSKMGLNVHITNDDISELTADGSSDISLSKVDNTKLTVYLNGASDIKASGKTGVFTARISGSGNINARALYAGDADISIDGAGDATVYASGKLRASIEGAGDISYYGDPEEVTKNISGAGEIEEGD